MTPEASRAAGRLDGADGPMAVPLPEGLTLEIAERRAIARLLPPGVVHQGVALEAEPLPEPSLEAACAPALDPAERPVVMLDQVMDPRNVGAVLRSAAAFGARAVIAQRSRAPGTTGTVAKAACGALESVPLVHVTNLARAIQQLKDMGYWVTGLDSDAETLLGASSLKHPVALVLGAEGSGLRRLTRENCDALVAIKLADSMHSLNVSNAAAIALYQLTLNP